VKEILVKDDEARRGQALPGCGHRVAEEAPKEVLAARTAFLAPYGAAAPRVAAASAARRHCTEKRRPDLSYADRPFRLPIPVVVVR
jgi:hypothetical protein